MLPVECLESGSAPRGQTSWEKYHLRQVAGWWKEEIRTGYLDTRDAWRDLTTHIMKTLEYPLLAKTFITVECQCILQLALEGGLHVFRIC